MWRIGTALTVATSLHVAVLGGALHWGEAGSGANPSTRAATELTHPALQVRTVHLGPPGPVAAAAPEVQAEVQAEHQAEAQVETQVEPQLAASPQAATPAPAPSPTLAAALPTEVEAHPTPAPESVATHPVASTEPAAAATPDVYHARRELSRAPKPLGPIDITFPPGVPTPGRHSAVLAIYIDEAGTVRKVQPVDAPLPDAFEEAARNAFLAARFRAGEREGRVVKSFIHIEVVFEERPESRGLALSGLGQSGH